MKIQVDIPDNLNKEMKIYKIRKDFVTLQEAIIDIISQFFKIKKDGNN
jgi:hypothetical protein